MASAERYKVAILGGGVVGTSTAYFLASKGLGEGVVVIEGTRIAAGASGKAGGFLARGWGQPGVTQELHEKGFDLHEKLAKDLSLESYRKLPTLEVDVLKKRKGKKAINAATTPAAKKPKTGDEKDGEHVETVLLNPSTTKTAMMDEGTAQVTPPELMSKLWAKAESGGVTLVVDKVSGLSRLERGGYSIKLSEQDTTIEADKVVLAMGPWTSIAEDWEALDKINIPVTGSAASSMVVHADPSKKKIAATACFCETDPFGNHLELFPRPDNSVYVSGFDDSEPLGKNILRDMGPDEVKSNEKRVERGKQSFAYVTSGLTDGDERVVLQCCMPPSSQDGVPMIGLLEHDRKDLFIGAGHSVWGILWGPITGKVLADLVQDGTTDLDLRPFDPLRFSRRSHRAARR